MYGYEQIIKAADEMGVNRTTAINSRLSYLRSELGSKVDVYVDMVVSVLDEPEQDFALYDRKLTAMFADIDKAKREMNNLKRRTRNKPAANEITDDMIERARLYPVELLVEFKRGKARAWCHDDRNPSAFHGTRTNTVQCPVCARGFGPIDVLMDRDGCSFAEAVRQLQ